MKHTYKITLIIILMFLISAFIGLYVVSHYSNPATPLPYGMGLSETEKNIDPINFLPSIILSFIVAISLIFLLTRMKAKLFLRLWFFVVVLLTLGISINSFITQSNNAALIAMLIALPFAIIKVYQRNIIIHNITELFIYPGIAAIFVPLLGLVSMLILLVLIAFYDMWAVWKSKIMQKMARFQMDQLKVFGGFFIPYLSKSQLKNFEKLKKSKKKIKVSVAILGGGDIAFSIIAAGVVLNTLGVWPAIITIGGALLGLSSLLFLFSKEKKSYPAMPFIVSGIILAVGVSLLIFV